MRRFRYDYNLTLSFSAPVARHTFMARFRPVSDMCQQIWGVELAAEPMSHLPVTTDAFGNICSCGYIENEHDKFVLHATGEALVRGGRLIAECPDYYRLPTEFTRADEALSGLARDLPDDPVECAMEISRRIRSRVEYRPGSTSERTTAAEAYRLGAGVCQDMAHMLLAVLRVKGIGARYVAGLIPGEGETHAWVEVHDGTGFAGIDPTQLIMTDDRFLRVSVGRDSRDCAINRGIFTGAAHQTISVAAIMEEI